ncbi:MAG: N-acetyltransferase [Candidatus Thiodiazotropha lotti]|uniref:N-acetyltransferase n=1 Tax=Candidatus Thiodiazotropha lotti TaxID=2792787 RepID=A0A9E4K6D3_9GAMM|nr:N-acetyltransferase [Candidatus Thiodiazotropha lotti]ODB98728.1 hypothetical protein A3197_15005 [Candidatus Thiodiazotropha endoloripes]MCG7919888.1 N-acetyltransferase [Candidatus Thiodiazotropha lotti]MCG7932314.1 N-acetyltransferase [Candidatus Thiodiazotropha lotti]MCG7940566.1 N-acetyltransferase [Candidatus Thiodiazotropha lotti]
MIIKASANEDVDAVIELHKQVFGATEGESVARLAADLLRDESVKPLISLVAMDEGQIVGHILFSSVTIEGALNCSGVILAPLAVREAYQKSGIGTALIKEGIERARKLQADFVLVLGDPNYYQRVGFWAGHGIEPPYQIDYPEAWMVLELNPGAVSDIKGKVRCAEAFGKRELW